MLSFWKFFIDKHHFTILLMVVLVAAGIYSAIVIPKESSPDVQIAVGYVITVLPGAGAEDVERLITDKIENQVIGLENVKKVTSTSGDGVSTIAVEFEADADIDKSIQLLKDEVDKVAPELPSEAEDSSVTGQNASDQPILLISISGDMTPAELTVLGEDLQAEIKRVAGISDVKLSGTRPREVQVVVEQAKLRQFGLALSDVTNAIRSSGLASPIGSITVDGVEYSVRLEANLADTSEVGNVILKSPSGAILSVRDVARVVDGLEDPRTASRLSVDGEPSSGALTLAVYKSPGGNIVDTGTAVKAKLTELNDTMLVGTDTVISYDAADDVAEQLSELIRVGLETTILVMLVLFATLGWRESLVAAISIPFSFLIAFIGLAYAGTTINFISLFSLILAIGILVDSGIVVVEAIHTRLKHTGNKREAALGAIREYGWPLIAGTFTTVAVFAPLFFLSGVMGKYVASIPFTVIFVLLASIFVALGLIPLIAMYVVRPEMSRIEKIQEEYNDKARSWYKNFIRTILENRKKENRFLIGMGLLFVAAIFLPIFGLVNTVLFPEEDADFIYVEIEKPQGSELAQTDLSVREVEELLYADERIESFVVEVGSASAFSGGGVSGAKLANITVNLKEDRKQSSQEIGEELRKTLSSITSARISVTQPAGGPPSGAPVMITFLGDDRQALGEAVERAERILSDIPGIGETTTSTRTDSAEFVVSLDTAKAAQMGVSAPAVADTLRTALYGSKATDIRTGTDDIEVRVLLDLNPAYTDPSETNNVTIDAVRELTVLGTSGPVPLSAIADISYESANTAIRHEDGTRTATVQSTVAPGANAIEVTQAFEKAIAEESLPAGITMKLGGETEDVNKIFTEMVLALVAGAALMLAILVLEFNSFRHSFYLLLLIPLSLIGVLFGLMITGQPLSFPSMLGVIALAGVIINHAIILMDSIARIGRENPDQTLTDVVVEAASTRFRPIVLTTVTTVVGMIPLSLASAIWGPLAFTIMFGLTFAMVLTLILIPVLYHRWPGKKVRAHFRPETISS